MQITDCLGGVQVEIIPHGTFSAGEIFAVDVTDTANCVFAETSGGSGVWSKKITAGNCGMTTVTPVSVYQYHT